MIIEIFLNMNERIVVLIEELAYALGIVGLGAWDTITFEKGRQSSNVESYGGECATLSKARGYERNGR